MPEASPYDFIEPPPKGFVPPPSPGDAMGLQPRAAPSTPQSDAPVSAPPDELIPSAPNPELPAAQLVESPSRSNRDDVRKQTVDQWVTSGATPVAAEGIARAVNTESGFNPLSMGDYQGSQPTSFGMYQHHDERAVRLLAFAKATGKDAHDPAVQTAFAIQETKGGDPVAAAHWKEINNAKTPEEAEHLWRQYFERPKGTTLRDQWAPSGTGGLSGAVQAAQAELKDQTHAMERSIESAETRMHELALSQEPGSKERQKTLDEGRAEIATLKDKYKLLTASPPIEKPADIFANFGSPATIIALLGGLFARNHATAALSAAGAAMKAINENNHEAFERSYKTWQAQIKSTADIIQMQRQEIDDIVRDEDKAWEHKQTLIAQVFREHGMEMQALQMEHGDARAAFTHLQTLEFNENGIKAQAAQAEKLRHDINVDAGVAKYLDAHPGMTRDQIPAEDMATILNQAKLSGTAAGERLAGDPKVQAFEKFKQEHPNATSEELNAFIQQQHPSRSPQGQILEKYRQAYPHATPEELTNFYAGMQQTFAASRYFASGQAERVLRSFNAVAQHLEAYRDLMDALHNGETLRINQARNRFERELGYAAPNNAALAAKLLSGEISKAVQGGVGALADREAIQDPLSTANSPEAVLGIISTAQSFVKGQFDGLKQTYDGTGMGQVQPFETRLTPAAKALFEGNKGEPTERGANTLPHGIPEGSKKIGTYKGKDVYQAPDGSKWQ